MKKLLLFVTCITAALVFTVLLSAAPRRSPEQAFRMQMRQGQTAEINHLAKGPKKDRPHDMEARIKLLEKQVDQLLEIPSIVRHLKRMEQKRLALERRRPSTKRSGYTGGGARGTE